MAKQPVKPKKVDRLTKKARKEMGRILSWNSLPEHIEYGARLCQNKLGEIHLGRVVLGDEEEVDVRRSPRCLRGTKEVGTFHTHPTGTQDPSPTASDRAGSFADRHELMCIGGRVGYAAEVVKCFEPSGREWVETASWPAELDEDEE